VLIEERSVVPVPVTIGIPIGISYLLSIEEGLRDAKALVLVLYPREDKISMTIAKVEPSLNPVAIDETSSTFKYYRQCLADQTYLQLETLLTQISLSYRLEDTTRLSIYTNVKVISA
jgi:hypothetical protein